MRQFLWLVMLWLSATTVCAGQDLSDLYTYHDVANKVTAVFTKEKLVDASTGIVANFVVGERDLGVPPRFISLTFFGYHEVLQWQNVKTLTFSYGAKTFTREVECHFDGEDRDKTKDLVASKYVERVALAVPLPVASEIFATHIVTVKSVDGAVNLKLNASQMHGCHDLVNVLTLVRRPPDQRRTAPSLNGLPVTRTVFEDSGNATLTSTPTVRLDSLCSVWHS